MASLTAGTFVGAGSFRCRSCGYVLALTGLDALTACPRCAGEEFARASLFNTERIQQGEPGSAGALAEPAAADLESQLARARADLEHPGEYLCHAEGGEACTPAPP